MSTPQFIPRRERDAARRRPIESANVPDIGPDIVPSYLALVDSDGSECPTAGRGVRLAADLVALSTLVAMRAPLDLS